MADDLILDDTAALMAADPGEMLRAVASSGAQVRAGLELLDRDAVARLDLSGRPRAVVVSGMGGSGIVGDVLAAIAAQGASTPVVSLHDVVLPAWVGAVDTVISVSCSGGTEETLAVAAEAARRGCRLVSIASGGSPLHDLAAASTGSVLLDVDAQGRMPRASLWTLLTPLLMAGQQLGLVNGAEAGLREAADRLDAVALRCGMSEPLADNEAKLLGLALAESLPMVWGSGQMGPVAARRLAAQLNENAKMAVVVGALPEAHHNQIVALDAATSTDDDDLFRDRVSDPDPAARLRLLLVRDDEEHEHVARRADLSVRLAADRGVPVSVVRADPGHPVARLGDLVGLLDWASVYAALSLGVDPTPIGPITEVKALLAEGRS